MKQKFLIMILAGLIFSPSLSADNKDVQRRHLKCYLQLEDKSSVVHQFVYSEQTQQEFVNDLVGEKVFQQDGVSFLKIKSVYECVEAGKSFKNRQAKELEAATPF
ncbi:TapY2 family type IVa secretion system protein [Psychromonas aquimarina]|uniref:TapY2 family type IVa secretion system protein n=1 Tax=Psychromonas aquimarina TaxID=444919 RepID=UPI00040D5A55|nr:TapY2 family type IVa secretion system protein [Psychromonas aquimarina]